MPDTPTLEPGPGPEAADWLQPQRPEPYPYQLTGAEFLAARRTAYLADDPGLGKSGQVAMAADLVDAYRILVICPASLKVNWHREMALFGTPRHTLIPTALSRVPNDDKPLLCIVNYDIAIRPQLHAQLHASEWDLVVCDEAHALKSPTAKRTRAVLGERALVMAGHRVWLVSGTPCPNHPGELYPALYRLHRSATLGLDYDKWLSRYCIVAPGAHGPRVMGNRPEIGELKDALDGWLLRRKVADVLPDLPPLRIGTLTVENDSALEALRAVEGGADVIEEMAELEALLGSEDVSDAVMDYVDELPLATLRRLCGEAKAHALVPLIRDELEGGIEQLVVMAWHKRTLDILQEGLADYGIARIDGAVPNERRQHQVDRFQGRVRDDCPRLFLGQILAAGTGHTLTAAHHMLIVEPSWVPGENAQAMLRIRRIGQQWPCLVRYVELARSLDGVIMRVAARKAALVAEVIE